MDDASMESGQRGKSGTTAEMARPLGAGKPVYISTPRPGRPHGWRRGVAPDAGRVRLARHRYSANDECDHRPYIRCAELLSDGMVALAVRGRQRQRFHAAGLDDHASDGVSVAGESGVDAS